MARKLCPACRRMNAGSATTCTSCGQAFDPSSIVSPVRLKTCPACAAKSRLALERCGCGHVFEDVQELRAELTDRVHVGWSYVVLGLVFSAGYTGLMLAISVRWILPYALGLWLIVRGLRMRTHALHELDKIEGATAEPPRAQLVR